MVTPPSVPALCPGGTVVCVGGGPSVTLDDVWYCQQRADRVIAINNAYQIAPWADVLYAADARWWNWHHGAPIFQGLKYSIETTALVLGWPSVQRLHNTGEFGLESNPHGVRSGYDSGYQAINVAVHLGASRIVLLGYDMQTGPNGRAHWHGDHPAQREIPYDVYRTAYPSLLDPLKALKVTLINATRRTALDVFPRRRLRKAL